MRGRTKNSLALVIDKYNELYGKDSYEDDYLNIQLSVSENISHFQKLLPELSSR